MVQVVRQGTPAVHPAGRLLSSIAAANRRERPPRASRRTIVVARARCLTIT